MSQTNASIEEVKEKHTPELMQIEGVEGVGITEHNGKPAIVLYVSDKKKVEKKVPSEIEGHPVKIEVTGSFQAF